MKSKSIIISLGLLVCSAITLQAQELDTVDVARSLSPREVALRQMARAETSTVKTYLSGLSRKEARTFDARLLSALMHLHALDVNRAQSELTILSKGKPRGEELEHLSRVVAQTEQVERMLSNVFMVPLVSNTVGATKVIESALRRETAHLGTTEVDRYTTADGTMSWQVLSSPSGHPAFGIIHRLGDGTWDKEGMHTVEVNGIDPGGSIAYPFLMQDGQTLYFAYTGPGTLGGYDLYVTRYDRTSGALLVPQQLPMPYNSTASDLLYMVDEETHVGYLLTYRGTVEGECRLLVLKPEEQKRVDTDNVEIIRRIALMDSTLTAQTPERIRYHRESASLVKTPILYVGSKAVHSESDLRSHEAQASLRRLLGLLDQRDRREEQLYDIRRAIREGRAADLKASTVLELEEGLLDIEHEIKALRNAVIRYESGQ